MLFVRELVFTVFIGFFFGGLQYTNGECNGLTTYLSSSQNGSFYVYMDSSGFVNRSCTWLITAPIGQRVLIYLTTLKFLYCYSDIGVTITDGPYTWSPRLAKYCGRDLPRPVYSSGRQILITFQPSFDFSEYFTLHYSTLFRHSSGCPSIVPGASAGVIYSPNFPWNYAESKSCDWYIEVPYPQYININFTYINTYECEGYVEIYDEYGDLKRRVSLCYSPIPSSVTYSESVRVRYYPYSSSSSFLAFYQIGYNVPFPVTTNPPLPTSQSCRGCQPYSEKTHRLRIPGIVVPSVIGVVLFAAIITIIKCVKIRRPTGEQGSLQLPLMLVPTSPDDEEMIDLTEDNNTACGNFETA